jgi:HprK-related kinase A
MRHSTTIACGPVNFRIGSDWRAPIAALNALYVAYPKPASRIPHYTVRLEATAWWRRWISPSIAISGDFWLPEAAPLPLRLGLLAAEMAMNLQVALGERRFLLIHAASIEKDGKALILTGESGSGKSTLAALLATKGWRFLGDEFALIEPQTGMVHPFPRPTSLKKEAIAAMTARLPEDRFGPLLRDTPKGDIRHLIPPVNALERMREPATPALLLYPRFGAEAATREIGQAENFVRLTQASTNYMALGETGFAALTRFVDQVPAHAIDYPDADAAIRAVNRLWKAHA